MREILFRGKRTDTGEWAYGDLLGRSVIVPTGYSFFVDEGFLAEMDGNPAYCVDPETVGQYIGLRDKNGKMIFEGDVLESKHGIKYLVNFESGEFQLSSKSGQNFFIGYAWSGSVIGNIHDNPKLMGGEE